jgi:hypothetical protein
MFTAEIRHVEWSLVIVSPAVPQDAPTEGGGGGAAAVVVGAGGGGGAGVVVGVVVVVGAVVVGGGVVGMVGVGLVLVGAVVVVGGGCGVGVPPKPWLGGGTLLVLLGSVTGGGVPRPGTGRRPWSGGGTNVPPAAAAKLLTLPFAACASCGISLLPAGLPTRLRPPLEAANLPVGAGPKPPRSSTEL